MTSTYPDDTVSINIFSNATYQKRIWPLHRRGSKWDTKLLASIHTVFYPCVICASYPVRVHKRLKGQLIYTRPFSFYIIDRKTEHSPYMIYMRIPLEYKPADGSSIDPDMEPLNSCLD
jgi:hypothetical protein